MVEVDVTEKRPGARYHGYMKGWHDGAGVKAIRPELANDADYLEGYRDGRLAGREAARVAGERLGYKPLVLKAAGDDKAVEVGDG